MTPTYIYGFADSIREVVLHEPSAPDVPEALVHDVWRNQRLQVSGLKTVGGIPVTVLDPGVHNSDAGPDFIGARLRLGSTAWTGSVEIHTASGTWLDHGHDRDHRYNSTLLHVVLYHDIWTGKLHRADGTLLPELVLLPHLEAPIRRLIHSFYSRSESRILCASGWSRVPDTVREAYLERLAEERMTAKARRFATASDSEVCLYEGIFAGLGYAKNAAPMRTLTRIISLDTARSLDDGTDVEALFFGASGLLPHPSDLLDTDRETADYVVDLSDRFERLNQRFDIVPMPVTAWRFFRLRPANFPTLRIAQAAALLHPEGGLLRSKPLEKLENAARLDKPLAGLRKLFEVKLASFWNVHVRLNKRTTHRGSTIGRERINALLVNVALPALIACGPRESEISYELLQLLPPTADEVTRHFEALGTRPSSAAQTQSLHQLFRTRCCEARCLSCDIGKHLLAAPP